MGIQYLLTLQDFRTGIQDAWTPFMEFISMFATTYLILIPVFCYWNRDKRKGLFVLVSYYFQAGLLGHPCVLLHRFVPALPEASGKTGILCQAVMVTQRDGYRISQQE